MAGLAASDGNGRATPPAVRWTVFEDDDHVHAVADVPASVPRGELGYGAVPTAASVFVGTPAVREWPVALPATVEPVPVSVSYNNAVVELVFERDRGRGGED